ncbi:MULTISPECIES: OB-fold nucleic acid binding domain-containing protein [Cellulomonas]|uniref:Nucleic acid binding OB-fold tRNA/helicase-type n=1 Tax=Cellulomonas gilvus (strain ATCC 13127 / NRRL B-14078) TaxID=593907 RepID=F8A3S7_CELGA|nr:MULTISPECIES: OB-fold nucleic acid binding domain-containing protein [Cellulomonas]AEI11980.1 nucleic acid binding OB-fold tRNA/helicase-type [Cellulomonas gilvus ATCC 13127]MCR6690240.1 OB-fold nucleic acid binding domain-containing protein [Cellulomonas sp.]
MSLKERLRQLAASQAQIEADEERADARRAVGCTAVDKLPLRSRAKVSGVIRSVTFRPRDGVPALEAELYDGSGSLALVWLGRREIAGIAPGRRLMVDGLVCQVEGRRTVFNPRYELRARPGE